MREHTCTLSHKTPAIGIGIINSFMIQAIVATLGHTTEITPNRQRLFTIQYMAHKHKEEIIRRRYEHHMLQYSNQCADLYMRYISRNGLVLADNQLYLP